MARNISRLLYEFLQLEILFQLKERIKALHLASSDLNRNEEPVLLYTFKINISLDMAFVHLPH